MTLSLTCRSCGEIIAAETEDELVTRCQDHACAHGHGNGQGKPLTREHVLSRLRHERTPRQ